MFSSAILSLAFAASVFSMPALNGRQSGACAGLASGSTDSPSYNFTLSAYNLTLPNANNTGAPLVLAWGPGSDDPAASEWVLSTYASWGSNEWPSISLEAGALLPQPGPDEDGLGAYNFENDAGAEVNFAVTTKESSPENAEIWCAAVDDSTEYAVLAESGDADNFSLCTATTDWISGSQINLVYSPVADNDDEYDYSSCYSVRVLLIPN